LLENVIGTLDSVQSYDFDCVGFSVIAGPVPSAFDPSGFRLQAGAFGSLTAMLSSATSPSFSTVMRKTTSVPTSGVEVWPGASVFVTVMCGWMTSMSAVSVLVTV
jgi:hypothetical protein